MRHAWLIAGLGHLLPPGERDWPQAMLAELRAIPDEARRTRFALGCARALIGAATASHLRACFANRTGIGMAFVAGVAIAFLDQSSASRLPMWLTLIPASAMFGWRFPAGAWRWGLLLALGIPLLALLSGIFGPYAVDKADLMYGIPPALLMSTISGRLRFRIQPLLLVLLVLGMTTDARSGIAQSARSEPALAAEDIGAFADSAFADYLRLSPGASLAFVVVTDRGIVFSRGYGHEDAAASRGVDPEATVFWLASVSKLLTTDAVMRERDRGRIDLRTPISSYLDFALPSRDHWRDVTVEDLLTHTSGLDEPFMQGSESDQSRLRPLRDYLASVRWRAGTRPGYVLRYSNHGMALAGEIVEQTSGTPFADYVRREIFLPLGMLHSSFEQPLPSDLARRIATAGTDDVTDYLLPSPAGAMVGTAADMGRFLAAQLDTTGPHAAAIREMQATHWRGHPEVPGVALGWFECSLGGVPGLYHTGARHHFSVAWLAPSRRVGLFLVHSARQGGQFQNLRTDVVRSFAERFLGPDTVPRATRFSARSIAGVYRPAILATTTVERAGYLFLDTPVAAAANGGIIVHPPGGLGPLAADPIGHGLFEVREGPQTGLRLGFVFEGGPSRLVMGGSLLDPVVFTRISWWQRGTLHAVLLLVACLALVVPAGARAVAWVVRRKRGTADVLDAPWLIVCSTGLALVLAPTAFAVVLLTTPELGAAEHMRNGLRAVSTFLSVAAALCVALPFAVLAGSQGASRRLPGKVALSFLSAAGLVVALLLWHYRMVGLQI